MKGENFVIVGCYILVFINAVKGGNGCRNLIFLPCIQDKTLRRDAISRLDIPANDQGIDECQTRCFFEKKCISYNLGPVDGQRRACELIDVDHLSFPDDVIPHQGSEYCPLKNPCSSNPCDAGKVCEPDFSRDSFICLNVVNCAQVLQNGHSKSGVYTVRPDAGSAFQVYCDQETNGGGWTVIQRRQDGSQDFYLGWQSYKLGFGSLTGEFWLGLDNIYRLTRNIKNRLRVELEDTVYAEYDYFAVSSEVDKYTLSLGSYSGKTGKEDRERVQYCQIPEPRSNIH